MDAMEEAYNKELDAKLAAMLAPEGSNYVMLCSDCRTAWPYQRDCKTTKAARNGNANCPECGETLKMPVDSKSA